MAWKWWTLTLAVLLASCSSDAGTGDSVTTSVVPTTIATTMSEPPSESTTSSTASTTTTTEVPLPIAASDPGLVVYVEYTSEPGWYTEVFTMNPDGTDQRRTTFDGGEYLGQVDVGEEYPLDAYSSSYRPSWSPDGDQLAFLTRVSLDRTEARVVDPDGSNLNVLFADWEGGMLSWSPDGSRIAYTTEDGVWVANPDGTSAELLAVPITTPIGPCGPTSAMFSTTWSPDGRWVAFIEADAVGYCAGVETIGIAEVSSGSVTRGICTEGTNQYIDWHPTVTTLLISNCSGSAAIVGTDGIILESLPFTPYAPAWSPTGSGVLYNSAQPWGDEGALWYFDVERQSSIQLLESFGGDSMDWQPVGG